MKNLSVVVVALLLSLPVIADEVKSQPLLTLASVDTSASVNLHNAEVSDLGARLDSAVKEASNAFSAKIAAQLPVVISKQVVESVKF